jgi:hypothetical protein
MNTDDFEKRLRRQTLRQVPQEWRKEILRDASVSAQSPALARGAKAQRRRETKKNISWLSTLSKQLSTILWPHPKAWAGLAAVWVLIFLLNVASQDHSPQFTKKSAPASPEMLAGLRDQQKLLAELIGANESSGIEQPRRFPAQPHSERRQTTAMA